MKKVLDRFSWATEQEINWNKSEIFLFHTEVGSQRAIARLFGIRIGQLLGKFLGMSLFAGVGKTKIWKGLLDDCKEKMEGWKSKWLTSAGRLLMLKTVVSAMLIFPMACFKLPSLVIKNMQQKMREFLWNGNQEQDKILLIAWDRVCKPKGGGGAGLCDWKLINEAMGAKLVWQMYSKPEQRWVRILQAKYLDSGEKERILTDSWDGCPSLDSQVPQRIKDKIAHIWGSKVCEFLSQETSALGQRLNWKDPRDLNLGEVDERLLRNVLNNRDVLSSRDEDEIVWCGAKSGSYSVKLGYTLLEIEGRTKECEAKLC
ncbi:uncharacterized protein LOC131029396 [Cryptomeria japonica]|uniref:uncharacterized protein LOC131029396 n=1 Tax=Cryptomeria japonica TaxID=3369 RepID=UPI0025AC5A3D|nr:uncharacterized protein LOC131029396 [Cryptomeria japonica]